MDGTTRRPSTLNSGQWTVDTEHWTADCGLAVVLSKFLDNQFSSGTTFVAELIEADLPRMVCVCWDGNEASVRGRGTMAGVGVQRGAVCGASDRCSTVRCNEVGALRIAQHLGSVCCRAWVCTRVFDGWCVCKHCVFCLQNAMTSSRERMSAEAEGYRIERSLMDCVAPPRRGGDAIHQCPRADSRLLRGIFARAKLLLWDSN